MQFINIVVHSTEDMNYRVHLQHEFTNLALDKYLDVSSILPTMHIVMSIKTQTSTCSLM